LKHCSIDGGGHEALDDKTKPYGGREGGRERERVCESEERESERGRGVNERERVCESEERESESGRE
jgi:hypothetical protein